MGLVLSLCLNTLSLTVANSQNGGTDSRERKFPHYLPQKSLPGTGNRGCSWTCKDKLNVVADFLGTISVLNQTLCSAALGEEQHKLVFPVAELSSWTGALPVLSSAAFLLQDPVNLAIFTLQSL